MNPGSISTDYSICPCGIVSSPISGESRTLQEELLNPQTLAQAVIRMLRLLDALETRHRTCDLHLDICPKNILLTSGEQGEKIILTGCAGRKCPHCRSGYGAPEVIGGQEPDFSSDLYSVAAVFFHCLMGRKLSLREALQPKAPDGRDSPLLRDAPAEVRRMVGKILRRGLNVLPEQRYRSIGPMRRAFQQLLDSIPSQ